MKQSLNAVISTKVDFETKINKNKKKLRSTEVA